jgi:hypothetical protein
MATCEGCCHLTGAMLNLAAEAADRARIELPFVHHWTTFVIVQVAHVRDVADLYEVFYQE